MADYEKVLWLYVATLIAPAIVLAGAIWASAVRHQSFHFSREDLLTLATVPSSITIMASMVVTVQTPAISWITFVYISVGIILSFVVVYVDGRTHKVWRDCEVAYCLLYFGAHWLLYAFVLLVGVPSL